MKCRQCCNVVWGLSMNILCAIITFLLPSYSSCLPLAYPVLCKIKSIFCYIKNALSYIKINGHNYQNTFFLICQIHKYMSNINWYAYLFTCLSLTCKRVSTKHIHTYIYTHTHTHTHTYVYTYICIYIYIFTFVRIYICIHIYMYIYIHICT